MYCGRSSPSALTIAAKARTMADGQFAARAADAPPLPPAYQVLPMHCFVYASLRKADTYVWLTRQGDFSVLPESLALMLGDLRFVLEVELDAQRKLPKEDVAAVLANLQAQGWHLQLPPAHALAVPQPALKESPGGPDE